MYGRQDPSPKFCNRCKHDLGKREELKKFLQGVAEKFEKALLNMPNLRSFVGPVESSNAVGSLEKSLFTLNVRQDFPPEAFYVYIRAVSGAHWKHSRPYQQDQLLYLMRFFGWRNSLGKRLENIKVEFDCRLLFGERKALQYIGWGKKGQQKSSNSCSHSEQNYSLFIDSVLEATDVEFTTYTGPNRRTTEMSFLGEPGQDLIAAAQGVKHLCFKIADGEHRKSDAFSSQEPRHGEKVVIGLDLSLPKWKDLQILRLDGIEAIATSIASLLSSHVSRLRELYLIDIALYIEEDKQDTVWWTIFKLIRNQNMDRKLVTVNFSDLRQKAGYVAKEREAIHDGYGLKRSIQNDKYALEYFSAVFASSRVYQLGFQQKIYDFILHKTDFEPEEQDDWDFAHTHVETCEVDVSCRSCPYKDLHESLYDFYATTRGKIRFAIKDWNPNKLFIYMSGTSGTSG